MVVLLTFLLGTWIDMVDEKGVLWCEEGGDRGIEDSGRGGDVLLDTKVAKDIDHADLVNACLLSQCPISNLHAKKNSLPFLRTRRASPMLANDGRDLITSSLM